MRFGRRKPGRRVRDPFQHLADERRRAEASAWFVGPDDGPELDVETGISSNLDRDDLDRGDLDRDGLDRDGADGR